MGNQLWRRVVLAGGFVALIVLVVVLGFLVFEAQKAAPTIYEATLVPPDPGTLLDATDKPVGMIFSLTLGLFVLAGYSLREMPPEMRRAPFTLAVCVLFVAGAVFSIYMGFLARSVALYYVSFRQSASVSLIGSFIGWQGLGTAAAALAALLLLSESLFLTTAIPKEKTATGDPDALQVK